MRFSPLKKNNKATVLTIIFSVTAVVLFVISAFVSRFSAFYQISSLILAVYSIQVYLKYISSEYVYEATNENFKIYRVNGNKKTCVASLSYEKSKSLCISLEEFDLQKNTLPKYKYTVNYAKNIYPDEYCLYLFD